MTETVLVTGGSGYLAGWCIAELLKRGYVVRATLRRLAKEPMVRSSVAAVADPRNLSFWAADLTGDEGWEAAVAGCDYVLHVASPLGVNNSRSPNDLIVPARDGTLRVLRAAVTAGVKRVVMTSAANAASPSSYTEEGVTDETLWTDSDDPTLIPYRRSKTLAEKAAWELMKTAGGETTLTTVLPGAVFGPILSRDNLHSVQVIGRLLRGEMPGLPRIGLEVVDVRDLVDVHLRAMTAQAAAGERFLATGELIWLSEVAQVLRDNLGAAASKVPTRTIPDFMVRLMAIMKPELREIAISLGRKNRHTTGKAETVLGWRPRSARETIIDCAKSLKEWKVA
ncbi:MAG TPA: NAD-dependent epimerase/dehydratase family protein [Blastocatellia bacterium]|nr:NAD-dependent epimerase/dehydratase family protein [Blastocatellia bacterium]